MLGFEFNRDVMCSLSLHFCAAFTRMHGPGLAGPQTADDSMKISNERWDALVAGRVLKLQLGHERSRDRHYRR